MTKDLNYYMALPYPIKVEELLEDEGGGFFLSIPLLGEMAVNAHGYTYDEARADLEEMKRYFLRIWLNAGIEIPEPDNGYKTSEQLVQRVTRAVEDYELVEA